MHWWFSRLSTLPPRLSITGYFEIARSFECCLTPTNSADGIPTIAFDTLLRLPI
jgi:hypothetical protein